MKKLFFLPFLILPGVLSASECMTYVPDNRPSTECTSFKDIIRSSVSSYRCYVPGKTMYHDFGIYRDMTLDACNSERNITYCIEQGQYGLTPGYYVGIVERLYPLHCPHTYPLTEDGLCVEAGCDGVDPDSTEFCSDGYPPNLLGYPGCDRPDLKTCSNGDIVTVWDNCPIDGSDYCSSYDTCLQYARDRCPDGIVKDYIYHSPDTFSFTCDETDDPHTDGGEHPYYGPEAHEIAREIDKQLQDDFRFFNETIVDQSDKTREQLAIIDATQDELLWETQYGLGAIRTEITNQSMEQKFWFQDLENALYEGTGDIVRVLNRISGQISRLGGDTGGEGEGEGEEPCDPTPDNNYCENPHGLDSAGFSGYIEGIEVEADSIIDSAGDLVSSQITELQNSSEYSFFDGSFLNGIYDPLEEIFSISQSGSCNPLVFRVDHMFGSEQFSIDCAISERFKSFLGWVFYVLTFISIVEILFSGITPQIGKSNLGRG